MKKSFRLYEKWLLFACAVLILFGYCVCGVKSTELIDDHREDDLYRIKEDDDEARKEDEVYQVATADKLSKTMIDHDEQRVRNTVSDHEIPKVVPTKVKIVGDLATPSPNSNISLGFVPKQTYVQVRRYDKELHLPRKAALAEAETAEELLNAPRLREVVSQKKTQEVYEEQGYEDAAYNHGGYKKGGKLHEIKNIPREDKTDNARTSDQSTEQAEIVKVGRYDITDSSHSEPKFTTERKNFINRRAKQPKTRIPWSRPKSPPPNERLSKPFTSSEQLDDDKRSSVANRRRRPKPFKVGTTARPLQTTPDARVMEESKFHATKKYITELDIKPTTYRPIPPPRLNGIALKKPQHVAPVTAFKIPPVPRIGNDGYKFENPFENFKDFNDAPATEYPLASKTRTNMKSVHEKGNIQRIPQYEVHETVSKYAESREVNKIQQLPSTVLKIKPTELASKYPIRSKSFPHSLLQNSNNILKPDQQNRINPNVKLPLPNFPYKIIYSTEMIRNTEPLKANTNDKWRLNLNFVPPPKSNFAPRESNFEPPKSNFIPQKSNFVPNTLNFVPPKSNFTPQKSTAFDFRDEKLRKNLSFAFGEPDRAPWIPITPKDIYDIHGYAYRGSVPLEIKVTENENSAEIQPNMLTGMPIHIYNAPKAISTSYSIQHSTYVPPIKSRPIKNRFPITESANRYDIHDAAESSYKLNGYASVTPATFLPMIPKLTPYAHSTLPRPTFVSTEQVTPRVQLKSSHPYDIIGAHSSDIRSTFPATPPFRLMPTRNTIPTNTTPKIHEIKDGDILSSNRYAIFQRANFTTAVETTTGSLKEMNEQFNKLFSEERDKFLFRHPHLSRETTNFLKPEVEETTTNTTSKRDIVLSSVKNGTITHLTKVSKRNDIHQRPILVYPQDYSSSAKYVERLTLAHFSAPENNAKSSSVPNYHDRLATLYGHLRNDTGSRSKRDVDYENEELVKVVLGGTTTEISVNVQKYPFYKRVRPDGISKYSVLRYVSNPKEIPAKRVGQMTFYESRNRVQCVEPSPPQNIVPPRDEGRWAYNPQPKLPRITLGDKIACLKIKFFGSDPLDNPFFKEESVGFPEIFDKRGERAGMVGDKDEFDQGTAAGIVIESVDDPGDFELVPKSLLNGKSKKVSAQFKRAVPERAGQNYMKSSVRLWIDSLAQPKTFKLYKRSPPDKFDESQSLDSAEKRTSKVIFVGGFLNRQNTDPGKKKKLKHAEKFRANTNRVAESTTAGTIQTSDTTADPKIMQKFNEDLVSILETSDELTSGEIPEVVRHYNKSLSRPSYQQFGSLKASSNEVKYLPSASEFRPKASKSPNRVYVDALTSLRSQQNVLKNKPISDSTNYKYNYKEPTWRQKNIATVQPIRTTTKVSTESSGIDSLLYVINPKTGVGKWMKVLKVEEMEDGDGNSIKADLESSSNDETASAIPHPVHYDEGSGVRNTYREHESQMPCQSDTNEIKKPFGGDYDVYHISGLLKQVAPLKASGVEINNLQTTEGQVEDDDDVSNSYFDLEEDDLDTTTQFPEPHERLYYYVVDDGTNERKAIRRK